MKLLSHCVIAAITILVCVSMTHAQDLSQYRTFAFGASVASISKQLDRPNEAQTIHQQPALIQELTWYPPLPLGSSRPAEPVQKILFSFYNGALYKMLLVYDNEAIKGLTDEDMIQIVSAKYGDATKPVATIDFPIDPMYTTSEKVMARWENSHYSMNLFRSSIEDTFAIIMLDKRVDALADVSIAESVKLEQQEAHQKDSERAKKEAADLEGERQQNIKTLRP